MFDEFWVMKIIEIFLWREIKSKSERSLFAFFIELLEENSIPASSTRRKELFGTSFMFSIGVIHIGNLSFRKPIAKTFLFFEAMFSKIFIPNADFPEPLAPRIIPIFP